MAKTRQFLSIIQLYKDQQRIFNKEQEMLLKELIGELR
jgi:hypothetical protein